jgi:nuclear transcription factor Y gamma
MNDSAEHSPGHGSNSNDSQSGSGEALQMLEQFWPNALDELTNLKNHDFKNQELPLARIKRIMKLDDDAAMMVSTFWNRLFG